MSERLRQLNIDNLEKLVEPGSKGFFAKMAFANRILPHVIGTPFQQTIINCFEKSDIDFRRKRAAITLGKTELNEWPVNSEELINGLAEQQQSLKYALKMMENAKETRRKQVKKDRVVFSKEEQEELRRFFESLSTPQQINTAKEFGRLTNPDNIPETENRLLEIEGTLNFVRDLIEKGLI